VFDRWRKAKEGARELDLIPVMNLMVTLIPFLLLGAAFYHVGVIPTSLPTNAPPPDTPPPSELIITMNMQFEADRIRFSGSHDDLDEAANAALGAEFPRAAGGFDLDAIRAHLGGIKDNYPKSETLVVLPDDAVRYQDLVAVLDVTRERPGAGGADPVPLFPVTVFSRLLVATPDAGVGAGSDPAAEAAPAEGVE
jgi:biopolymer transport protein ExbD